MSGNVLDRLKPRFAALLVTAFAVTTLAGCATPPSDPVAKAEFEKENDPLEPLNRAIFSFNMTVDKVLLRPAAIVYRDALPVPVQKGVHNFLANLRTPVVFANDLLQGEVDRAGTTVGRFAVNTTLGVLGVWDPATELGIPGHSEDFGQTFGVWGIGEGFYFVLPILGPSNPRDATGLLTEYLIDPFNLWAREENVEGWILARSLVTGVDFRARNLDTLDEIERTSLDYYVAIRSLYRQRRADEIRNGKSTSDQPAPGISVAPENKPAAQDEKSANAN